MNKAFVIGVSGMVGSGKSEFCRLLSDKLNAPIINADKVGHRSLEDVQDILVNIWGKGILDDDGKPDRKKIGEIVFSSETQLLRLESIMHPHMYRLIKEELSRLSGIVILEAALLFRMKANRLCDYTIFIEAEEESIIHRLMENRDMSRSNIYKVLSMQKDVKGYGEGSDKIIRNTGSIEHLKDEVQKTIKSLPYVQH